MKFAVIVFPGSNCDYDAYYVVKKILHLNVEFVWHKNSDLSDFDCIIIPGGFSYGDYLRAGAIARFSHIMQSVKEEGAKGKPIIGICNGFQILVESQLLPGALITNNSVKFISKEVVLKAENITSIFTNKLSLGQHLRMPIAHQQGNYFATQTLLDKLQENEQIAFRYQTNPNGSCQDIAGIFNKQKNILGMMPHPERASELTLGSNDGLGIFESILSAVSL